MLDGRDWLMGEAVGAADICAFPFLKYGVLGMPDNDDELFHRVLVDHLPITGAFPAIEAWVHRVDALPRA
jgi:glutathione S-transferase